MSTGPGIAGTETGAEVGLEGIDAVLGVEPTTTFLVPSQRMVVMAPNTSQRITIYSSTGGPYGGDLGTLVATSNDYGPIVAVPVQGSTSDFMIQNTSSFATTGVITFSIQAVAVSQQTANQQIDTESGMGIGIESGGVLGTEVSPSTYSQTSTPTSPNVTCYVTVIVYQQNTSVQNGRSAAQAVATVRRRTNLVFGEPSDADIVDMLNDGIEEVALRIEPIVAQASFLIAAPNTNVMPLPQDAERIRDANYSTGDPTSPGTVVYELVQLPYDEFIQETDSSPAGGIGGIPTIYTMIQDASGIMLVQFYPYANSGQFNFHYYKRPTMYGTTTSGNVVVADPASYTDLDSLWQQAVLAFACAQACENREDYKTAKDYFMDIFEKQVERNMLEIKRRVRKRGTVTVRDVSVNESVIPIWTR